MAPQAPAAERRKRSLTDEDVTALGAATARAIIDHLDDPDTVDRLSKVVGRLTDVIVGRGAKRIGMYVIVSLLALGAAKLDAGQLLAKLFSK